LRTRPEESRRIEGPLAPAAHGPGGVDGGHVLGADHRPDSLAHVVEGDALAQDAVELRRAPEGLFGVVDLVDPGLGRAQRRLQPPGVGAGLAARLGQGRDVVHVGDDARDGAGGVAPGAGLPAQAMLAAVAVGQAVLATHDGLAGQGALHGGHEALAGAVGQLLQRLADDLGLGGLEDVEEARADHGQAQFAVVEGHGEGRGLH
jgi:hypothetical protein